MRSISQLRNAGYFLLTIALFPLGFASAKAGEPTWSGKAGIGAVVARGNTNNSAVTGQVDIARKSGRLTHTFLADVHQARAEGVDTADRLLLGFKVDRELNERCYVWGSLRYDSDAFADIDERQTASLGLGYRLLLGPTHKLSLESGVGWRATTFISALPDTQDVPVNLALAYEGRFNDNVRLTQRLSAEVGKDNTLYASTTDLNVKMNGHLSLSLIYGIRRNTKIAGTLGKMTDSLTTVNLVYSF
jgi:putative salt-induced outer membrane protein